ncbi:Crp/Fnr family transcriptional regulator [Sphaerisporangium sp. NPDC005289]|uniref:Crp/Fnr family transcriptional regulator n=1 Tax=Sphaerisporangium sp. NPDC005289 TaxID=3155247 RepID=UPI0033A5ABC8
MIRNVGAWPRRGLLGGLPSEVRDELLALGRPWQYAAGTALTTEGEWSADAILLLDGCVGITSTRPMSASAAVPRIGTAPGSGGTWDAAAVPGISAVPEPRKGDDPGSDDDPGVVPGRGAGDDPGRDDGPGVVPGWGKGDSDRQGAVPRSGMGDGPRSVPGAGGVAGRAALVGIRAGGDLVGEAAVLAGRRQEVTVTAADACLARRIPPRELARLAVRFPEFAHAIYGPTGGRRAAARRYATGAYTAMGRLVRVLVELARCYGETVPEGVMIGVSLTRPELAGLAEAEDPAVGRALTVLRRTGVIGTGYRRIVVHDIRALRASAETGDGPAGGGPAR